LPVISGHNPSGTSVRTVSQFAKSYNLGARKSRNSRKSLTNLVKGLTNDDDISTGEKFIKYDYGPQGNMEHYGKTGLDK